MENNAKSIQSKSFDMFIRELKDLGVKVGPITINMADLQPLLDFLESYQYVFDMYDFVESEVVETIAAITIDKQKFDMLMANSNQYINKHRIKRMDFAFQKVQAIANR